METTTDTKIAMNEPGVDLSTTSGKFRFQNQRCILTYKTWLDKGEYKVWMAKKKGGIKFLELAHETGDSHHPYKHTHVLIDYGKIHQTTSVKYFDYKSKDKIIHPHIKVVKTVKHWDNCLLYMAKEDPANLHLKDLVSPSLVKMIWGCESLEDALVKHVKSPSDYLGVKGIYNEKKAAKKAAVHIPLDNLFPWQKAFFKVCLTSGGDTRTINWVYDEKGACGKTHLAHHMVDTYGKEWASVSNMGNTGDFYNNLKNLVDGGWTGGGLIIDLPRSYETGGIYEPLENVLNGRITTTKYTGGQIDLGSPIVWVFSNRAPKVSAMSKDRWRILKITKSTVRLMMYSKTGRLTHHAKITHGVIGHSFLPDQCESSDSLTADDDLSFDLSLLS